MSDIYHEHSGTQQGLSAFKRRKIGNFDQERAGAPWLATTRAWSPNESAESSQSFVDSPSSTLHSTPNRAACSAESLHVLEQRGFHGLARLSAGFQEGSSFYTPPAQRIVLPPHQLAPKLHLQPFQADHAWQPRGEQSHHQADNLFVHSSSAAGMLPVEMPYCGFKRLRLGSYTIASQLASGHVVRPAGLASGNFRWRSLSLRADMYNRSNGCYASQREPSASLQQRYILVRSRPSGSRLQISSGVAPCRPHIGSESEQMQLSSVRPALFGCQVGCSQPSIAPQLMETKFLSHGIPEFRAWGGKAHPLQPIQFRQQFVVPRCPPGVNQVLEQWASALGLLRETVMLTLHMFSRIQAKAPGSNDGLQTSLYLLGCLWVAAKHEECRTALPSAQKMAALVPDPGSVCVRSATVGAAELAVLNLLGWQPLRGWDDARFVKGQLRPLQELYELQWLSC